MIEKYHKHIEFDPEMNGLWFHISVDVHNHHMEFVCHECVGIGDKFYHPRKGSVDYIDLVDSTSEAQVFLHGSIKWDGCSNIHFDEQDDVMIHSCGRRDAGRIGRLLDRLYDIAASEIPTWDRELGE